MTSVLSLGSNVGDRLGHLRAALDVIGHELQVLAVSPTYETVAVGVADQADFLNCVAVVGSDDPQRVFAAARRAEETRGRLRSRRWGPRTLDVDVVSVDALTSSDPQLTLPHPRAHERAFVLLPWLDVQPDAVLIGYGPVRRLVALLDSSGVRRWP